MAKENYYEGIEHVIRISTSYEGNCEHCKKYSSGFAPAINHYIEEHGYKILHIGTESDFSDGVNHCWSVAILGK